MLYQETRLDQQVAAEMNQLAQDECSKIAKDVYLMLRVQDESIRNKLRASLNVAHNLMEQAGGVSFSKETLAWQATNQLTKQGREVVLPKMQVGNEWLGQNRDSGKPSPLVDELQSLVGGTCTDLPADGRNRRHAPRLHEREAGGRLTRHRHLHPGDQRGRDPKPRHSAPRFEARRSSAGRSSSTRGT